MRHLGTLIAAAIVAPLAWLLLAFGQDRSVQAFANAQSAGGFRTGDFLRPALCLAAAGVLVGLIGTLRLSPLGAALTGVVYTGSYAILLIDPQGLLDLFPATISIAGKFTDPTTPLRNGSALVLGVLLLIAVVGIGRRPRWAATGTPGTAPPDDTDLAPPARSRVLADAAGPWSATSAHTTDLTPVTRPAGHGDWAGNDISYWVSSLHGGDPDRRPRTERPAHWPFD